LASGGFATVDDQPHLRRLLPAGDLRHELPEPGLYLLDRAGSAAPAPRFEQFGGLHGDRFQPRQRLLHPLDEIVADLLGQLLRLQERLDPWQLAVPLAELHAAGLTRTDLRWLLARGLAAHAHKRPADGRRSFRPAPDLRLTATCAFILDAAAAPGLRAWAAAVLAAGAGLPTAPSGQPAWDPARRELRWGDRLVKRFAVPALLQEVILAAFEEDGWPPRIDDPLPPTAGRTRASGCTPRSRG
jgi:hypothetical protein